MCMISGVDDGLLFLAGNSVCIPTEDRGNERQIFDGLEKSQKVRDSE